MLMKVATTRLTKASHYVRPLRRMNHQSSDNINDSDSKYGTNDSDKVTDSNSNSNSGGFVSTILSQMKSETL